MLPPGIERLFDVVGQPPERHAARGLEDLGAAVSRYCEDGACLGEPVRAREATSESGGAQAAELAPCIPPASKVHLAKTRNHKPEP